MLSADVVVVGAGPAGSAAAGHLARAGLQVLVVDRARFPRDKCCGDGLTTAALRELEALGLEPGAVRSWRRVDEVTLRSPGGREIDLSFPSQLGTFAAVATRADLDAALVELARGAGAVVAEGCTLVGAAADAGGVRLDVDGLGQVAARYAIGADGMWSPLRRSLGVAPEGYLGDWHAFRQYFHDVSPQAANRLMVWFEPDLLPGYAWSFPLPGGRANVGFGILRGAGIPTRRMAGLWPALLARPHVASFLGRDARPAAPHKAWPIPARLGRLPLDAAGGRALFVGDAAAATDPLTGEGIAQALVTGRLAAEAVRLAGWDDPEGAASTYRRAVADELVADDRLARALSWVLARPRLTDACLGLVDTHRRSRAEFARWMFEASPRAAVLTPRRWGRLVGDGRRGAWGPQDAVTRAGRGPSRRGAPPSATRPGAGGRR